MPTYELKYFFYRAKAEPIRWLFSYLQIPFKDTIIDRWNEWPKIKNGLEAKTLEEQALCDMYAAHAHDVFEKLRPWIITFTRSIMKEYLEQRDKRTHEIFIPTITQDYGPIFEKQLKENSTGYLVGNQITWLDIFIAEFTDKLLTFGPTNVFAEFSNLKEHREKIIKLPNLQEYLKSRPNYLF